MRTMMSLLLLACTMLPALEIGYWRGAGEDWYFEVHITPYQHQADVHNAEYAYRARNGYTRHGKSLLMERDGAAVLGDGEFAMLEISDDGRRCMVDVDKLGGIKVTEEVNREHGFIDRLGPILRLGDEPPGGKLQGDPVTGTLP